MENRKKIISALKDKWPMAEWVYKDEWDDFHCSNCQAWGNIEDRFCSRCGSFMRNYEHEKRYHYTCKHCGASLDGVASYSIVVPDTEYDTPQVFAFDYPACGEKSEHIFDDARMDIKDDGFDEQLLARLEVIPWKS